MDSQYFFNKNNYGIEFKNIILFNIVSAKPGDLKRSHLQLKIFQIRKQIRQYATLELSKNRSDDIGTFCNK